MKLNQSVIKARSQLEGALAAGDLAELRRVRQRLVDMLVTATIDDDADTIRTIQELLTKARNEIVWRYRTGVDEGPEAISWMFEAEARVAAAAARARPRKVPAMPADRSVRERILRALAHANRPLSNVDLATQCRTAEETVSRIIRGLRSEGLLVTRKAGARNINLLTGKGRFEVGGALRSTFVPRGFGDSENQPAILNKFTEVELMARPLPDPSDHQSDNVSSVSKMKFNDVFDTGADLAQLHSKLMPATFNAK